jgi:hypothetical protein
MMVSDRNDNPIEVHIPPSGPRKGKALAPDDPVPAGPYRISMTWVSTTGKNYTLKPGGRWTRPYTIIGKGGVCIAGQIDTIEAAAMIRNALNITR